MKCAASFVGTSRASPGGSSTATWAGDSVFNGLRVDAIFAVREFTFDRKGLCRRKFFGFSIDKFLDLFRLAEQFLVDLRETLLVLFELRLVGAFIVESGVQAGQRGLVSVNGGFRFGIFVGRSPPRRRTEVSRDWAEGNPMWASGRGTSNHSPARL